MLKHTSYCEATGCELKFVLDICHIKPHYICSDEEKKDPHNALCLMSNIHRAFDNGYISFNEDGTILLSELLTEEDKLRLGLTGKEVIRLGGRRSDYLKYHRENIFNFKVKF